MSACIYMLVIYRNLVADWSYCIRCRKTQRCIITGSVGLHASRDPLDYREFSTFSMLVTSDDLDVIDSNDDDDDGDEFLRHRYT